MPKWRKNVTAALDVAFKCAQEWEQAEGTIEFDVHSAKFIIFSDHHKGNRDGADDFSACERAYNAALAYYNRLKYTLVVLGDGEELWEERPQTVLKAYSHTLMLEGKFHQEGRYMRFWGNHDDDWGHPDLVEQLLAPALGGGPLRVRETLIIHVKDGEEELGRLFLVHGHQGTLGSDLIAPVSKLCVRYIWRPLQRIFKFSFNTPAKDFQLRHAHDSAMYSWSAAQEKVALIAGHTHRPVFKSATHEAVIRKTCKNVEERLAQDPDNPELQQQAADLAAELEWILAQGRQPSANLAIMERNKPCYFNTGCCAFLDGDITGLEINAGTIQLVRWPNDEGVPKPKVLVSANLQDILAAC